MSSASPLDASASGFGTAVGASSFSTSSSSASSTTRVDASATLPDPSVSSASGDPKWQFVDAASHRRRRQQARTAGAHIASTVSTASRPGGGLWHGPSPGRVFSPTHAAAIGSGFAPRAVVGGGGSGGGFDGMYSSSSYQPTAATSSRAVGTGRRAVLSPSTASASLHVHSATADGAYESSFLQALTPPAATGTSTAAASISGGGRSSPAALATGGSNGTSQTSAPTSSTKSLYRPPPLWAGAGTEAAPGGWLPDDAAAGSTSAGHPRWTTAASSTNNAFRWSGARWSSAGGERKPTALPPPGLSPFIGGGAGVAGSGQLNGGASGVFGNRTTSTSGEGDDYSPEERRRYKTALLKARQIALEELMLPREWVIQRLNDLKEAAVDERTGLPRTTIEYDFRVLRWHKMMQQQPTSSSPSSVPTSVKDLPDEIVISAPPLHHGWPAATAATSSPSWIHSARSARASDGSPTTLAASASATPESPVVSTASAATPAAAATTVTTVDSLTATTPVVGGEASSSSPANTTPSSPTSAAVPASARGNDDAPAVTTASATPTQTTAAAQAPELYTFLRSKFYQQSKFHVDVQNAYYRLMNAQERLYFPVNVYTSSHRANGSVPTVSIGTPKPDRFEAIVSSTMSSSASVNHTPDDRPTTLSTVLVAPVATTNAM